MTPGPRPPLALTLTAVAGALLGLAGPAGAQQEPAKSDNGLERAQKAADAVFHWIKLNADKGASRQAPAPAPAVRKPATAPTAAAPKPPPAPNNAAQPTAQVQPQAQAPTTAPSSAIATAPPPEPQPDPVVLASAAPTPAPAAPMATAAQAAEPAPQPAEAAEAVEEPLKLLAKVDPTFPRQLLQQNLKKGFAQIQFTVAPDGTVSQAQAVKASHARLGTAAVDAVKQWRFAPVSRAREVAVEIAFNNSDD
ncbi:TonB family protein [Roseateles sp.]|uniref:TonB family protein n=1 Tax=Roseateles sp. TaxID=1971397 RepID=UPI003BA96B77